MTETAGSGSHPGPRRVSDLARVILAPNPGPMTLDGTNSYLLAGPGASGIVVVDPGPDDAAHLRALAAVGTVQLVLITHRHGDHTGGAAAFHALTGAPVRAADSAYCHGGRPLVDGELIEAAGVRIRVVATPGHTSDSVCFRLVDDVGGSVSGDAVSGGAVSSDPVSGDPVSGGAVSSDPVSGGAVARGSVLTGDTLLGRGTTVIAAPDGNLGAYLDSLRRLEAIGPAAVLPAHGPQLPDLAALCRAYLAHREQRLAEVRAALTQLGADASVCAVTDLVYADVDPSVRFAAEHSVAAQLNHLRNGG